MKTTNTAKRSRASWVVFFLFCAQLIFLLGSALFTTGCPFGGSDDSPLITIPGTTTTTGTRTTTTTTTVITGGSITTTTSTGTTTTGTTTTMTGGSTTTTTGTGP